MGTILSLGDILKRLDINDPVDIEHLKTLVRSHWQSDSRCPNNWFTTSIQTSKSSLALKLARELIDKPEYRSRFEEKRSGECIRLLSYMYLTQWKYNKDNNGRRSSTSQSIRPATTKAKRPTARSSKRQTESRQKYTQDNQNNLSRVSEEAERTRCEILSHRKSERQTSESDMEDINDILQPWVRLPSASGSLQSEPPEPASEERCKTEQSEDSTMHQLSDRNDAKDSAIDTEPSQDTTLSSGLTSQQEGSSFEVSMDGKTYRYKAEDMAQAVSVFARYVDRIRQEGREISAEGVFSKFHGIFGDFGTDPSEAVEIWVDGFV